MTILKNLTREEANNILDAAAEMNNGPWYKHSQNVAKATETLAKNLNLDPNRAYVYGLLHDVGRREGCTYVRHIIDGYNHMKNLGYEDIR